MATIRRGASCPNGAVIVDAKNSWVDGEKIILCLWLKDLQGSEPMLRNADPFVTWRAYLHPDTGEIVCNTGHYHDQLKDAVVDFASRM
jgi:hypothetical protein